MPIIKYDRFCDKRKKMKRLRPRKMVFAVPELIGIGSFIVAFTTYVSLIFFVSA